MINKVNVIADSVLDETPAQSLEAVKREWQHDLMEYCIQLADVDTQTVSIQDLEGLKP